MSRIQAELTVLAGFPNGVINILPGTGSVTGQAIADHPLVRKLGFTGSTEIGKTIMTSCAQSNIKKCSLELGGKSPLVIFADCDLDKAVKYVSYIFLSRSDLNSVNYKCLFPISYTGNVIGIFQQRRKLYFRRSSVRRR